MKRIPGKLLNIFLISILFTCFFVAFSYSYTLNSDTPVKIQEDNRLYKHNGSDNPDNNNQQTDKTPGKNQTLFPDNNSDPQGQNNTQQGTTADQAHPDGYF